VKAFLSVFSNFFLHMIFFFFSTIAIYFLYSFMFSSPSFSYDFKPSIHTTTTGPEGDESRRTDAGAWMWFLFSEN